MIALSCFFFLFQFSVCFRGKLSSKCHCLCLVPARRVFSSLDTRGKRVLFVEYPAHRTPRQVEEMRFSSAFKLSGIVILTDTAIATVTMLRTAPSFAISRPARRSQRPSKHRSVPTAAIRSSSTTCRRWYLRPTPLRFFASWMSCTRLPSCLSWQVSSRMRRWVTVLTWSSFWRESC